MKRTTKFVDNLIAQRSWINRSKIAKLIVKCIGVVVICFMVSGLPFFLLGYAIGSTVRAILTSIEETMKKNCPPSQQLPFTLPWINQSNVTKLIGIAKAICLVAFRLPFFVIGYVIGSTISVIWAGIKESWLTIR